MRCFGLLFSAHALAAAIALVCAACPSRDGDPEAAARSVWRAALSGNAQSFRALYPTREELASLFEPAVAARYLAQIDEAAAKVPKAPPRIELSAFKVAKEAEVAPMSGGLQRPARLARVALRIRIPGAENAESDDSLLLVKLPGGWRALPKEADGLLE